MEMKREIEEEGKRGRIKQRKERGIEQHIFVLN